MDGSMDGWMYGRTNWWMDGRQTEGWVCIKKAEWNGWIGGWVAWWIDTSSCIDAWVVGRMDGCVDEQSVVGYFDGWMHAWLGGR
jgi:hypothetical protein